ncbi:FAD-binding oxidoreductase [Streptomyces caniscabiei]|uniref:FAD-binding oxidoreductase n=1 Tax=Streptomyces caniscabiei TaxID=2746961 RepID=UPI0029B39F29|nr:FAD-binding oxidoreductase [Streptomyces caniscabiei]MDX2775899.1 FAD-binding oxidoreductase [Streptomyces caniscabiei]
MSKVAAYLQEHIKGKVSTNAAVLRAASTDESVLAMTPEMVIYPKVTSDVRKVLRFAWQLAEKGHVLSVTPRGYGGDQTGAAIGKGAVIVLPAHMNRIFELDSKQKLVRVQAGTSARALNDALQLQGMAVPALAAEPYDSTIGGAVANNTRGPLSGRYGDMSEWVHQAEVVLATGEVLQTERLSKRELQKKKGLQTFEGEIYRSVDALIDDNQGLIADKLADLPSNAGYSSIAKVKQKDGSFDLTPLFAGSQGTLGIISELILRTEFMSAHRTAAIATFKSADSARDAVDKLAELEPAFLEYFDNALFTIAAAQGKTYDFYKNAPGPVKAVILVGFDAFSERANHRKLKKVSKLLSHPDTEVVIADGEDVEDLLAVRDVASYLLLPSEKELYAPALFDGVYIPNEQFTIFAQGVQELSRNYDVVLPLYSRELEGIVFTRPLLRMNRVGDKQKMFKLLDEYAQLIAKVGGSLVAQDGEGRLKTRHARAQMDDDIVALFDAVKSIFDPYNILNPGVKQDIEPRVVASHVRTDFSTLAYVSQPAAY